MLGNSRLLHRMIEEYESYALYKNIILSVANDFKLYKSDVRVGHADAWLILCLMLIMPVLIRFVAQDWQRCRATAHTSHRVKSPPYIGKLAQSSWCCFVGVCQGKPQVTLWRSNLPSCSSECEVSNVPKASHKLLITITYVFKRAWCLYCSASSVAARFF